jgi:serine/threonine protein kinase
MNQTINSSKQYKNGSISDLNETINGIHFFRKFGASIAEHQIAKILQNNPHPHIVQIYRITDKYIDIEEVTPVILFPYDKEALVSAANLAKKHLQNLGIIYIDWKPDNLGLGSDGKYKLFDFDASGITSNNLWITTPTQSWVYTHALINGVNDPLEIDNFAFNFNFVVKKTQDTYF